MPNQNKLESRSLCTSIFSFTIILTIIFSGLVYAEQTEIELEQGFKKPPKAAQPRTWWHWTGGNVTLKGITKDLEWMKHVGIAGFQLADVNFGTGQTIEDKIMFGSSEWLKTVKHAAEEAARLDLEMAIFSSPGWSLAGGPWVKPRQAMKKLVWSEHKIEGPQFFSDQLPHPPTVNGPIRNMTHDGNDTPYYKDQAVIAYPTPFAELQQKEMKPSITVNGQVISGKELIDKDLNSSLTLPVNSDSNQIIIDFSYSKPVAIRAITIASRAGIPFGKILVSNDKKHFKTVQTLPGPQLYREGKVRTFSFPVEKARHFRLEITRKPYTPAQVIHQPHPKALEDSITLSEARLHQGARIHRWEAKAGFSFLFDYSSVATPQFSSTACIDPDRIIDITDKMDPQGNLDWQVPEGDWTILRLGYSLTGAKNKPPVPTGLGYEVDKLSAKHVKNYLEGYLDPIKDKLGSLYGERLQYLLLDSWEAGMQNWTDNMPQEFKQRRVYDLVDFLPVLTGRVVKNAEVSDRFLWDFRRTLADMFAQNFYGTVTEYLHKNGLKTYSEASGVSLEILEDALLCKKQVDIPMGEFWVRDLHPSSMYRVDVRGAASAAHIYGKKYVAAESFTGGGYEAPATLQKISDFWFTQGVNRIVFHTSTHQPLDIKPGNAMVGTHIHRNITWADQAQPFMTYLARNSFMLQQGKFVADIAYLLDEGAPSTMPFWGNGLKPERSAGYDYDYINTDVLLNRMAVDENDKLVLPDGMSYELLVLPGTSKMSLDVLQKIRELVKAGATVIGPKPESSPGLKNYPESDRKMQRITTEIWGDLDGTNRTIRYVGNGMVVWGESLVEILQRLGVEKDVKYSEGLKTDISWIHRKMNNTDFYFISNQSDVAQNLDFSFRIQGKEAELWHADKGHIKNASYQITNNRTVVPIYLEPDESVYVVFRNKAEKISRKIDEPEKSKILDIKSPWQVHFPEGWGAPKKIKLPALISWTEHQNSGVKYFSGTAEYTNSFNIQKKYTQENSSLWLDLGQVRDIAEVFLNGIKISTLWKQPFQTDISNFVKPGQNRLLIKVTNQWNNRLAGDQLLPEKKRVLEGFTPKFMGEWKAKESGLLGPVKIISINDNKIGK
ncbi:MAG: glycoside hydrolase [Candidatus Marinimicrobia bacterium]|nr:glycoside hydrolase [Candidatus Neomarinimicrobiota bacterium]